MNVPLAPLTEGTLNILLKGSGSLSLRLGETVKGLILNVLPNGSVSMKLKNSVIEAKTNLPLSKGDRILLKVDTKASEIRFRLIQDPVDSSKTNKQDILTAINKLKAMRLNSSEVGTLKTLLEKLPESLTKDIPDIAALKRLMLGIETVSSEALRYIIESGGLFFETRLKALVTKLLKKEGAESTTQPGDIIEEGMEEDDKVKIKKAFISTELDRIIEKDLKGLLFRLKGKMEDPGFIKQLSEGGIKPDELKTAIEKLLNNIENHQLQSKLNESMSTFLPFIWEGLKDGGMIIKEEEGGTIGANICSCIINLEFEKVGRLLTTVLMQSGSFHINIVGEDKDFLKLLQKKTAILEESFNASGLKLSGIRTQHKSPVEFIETLSKGIDVKV